MRGGTEAPSGGGGGARWTGTGVAHGAAGDISFEVDVRLDGGIEVDYYRNGGILPTVLRRLAGS